MNFKKVIVKPSFSKIKQSMKTCKKVKRKPKKSLKRKNPKIINLIMKLINHVDKSNSKARKNWTRL